MKHLFVPHDIALMAKEKVFNEQLNSVRNSCFYRNNFL